MTQQISNYRIKNNYVSAEFINQNESVFRLNPNVLIASPIPQIEFKLNNSFHEENSVSNNSNHDIKVEKNNFIDIHQVIQVILAQEKHKVARNEITEGTFRMTKVRLETNIAYFFDNTDLRTINMGSIARFIDFLSEQELSTPTIVGYIAQLRKVLRYLVEQAYITHMPMFPKMKVTQKPRGAFTVTEYAAILRQSKTLRQHVFVWNKPDTRFHIKPEYRSMPIEMNGLIRFMVYTFLRPGDVRAIEK